MAITTGPCESAVLSEFLYRVPDWRVLMQVSPEILALRVLALQDPVDPRLEVYLLTQDQHQQALHEGSMSTHNALQQERTVVAAEGRLYIDS